jgi:hypothetical protein
LADKFSVGKELTDHAKQPGSRENCSSKCTVSVHGNTYVLIVRIKDNPAESASAVTRNVYRETKGRLQYFMFRNLKTCIEAELQAQNTNGAAQFHKNHCLYETYFLIIN